MKNWLRKQQNYTLHKPIRRKFVRRKTVVAGIDYQWQGDLADVSNLAKYNDKYRYLFCLIEGFSKFAWVVPIKDKSGKTLVEAFKSVLKQERFPKSLQTDKGTEFQTFLKSQNIHFLTTENPETKASIVERFQRTLKNRMWKYFTHHRTLKYIDVLQNWFTGIIMLTIAALNVHRHRSMSKMKFKYRQFCMAKNINLQLQNCAWVILCASIKQNVLFKRAIYQIGPKNCLESRVS